MSKNKKNKNQAKKIEKENLYPAWQIDEFVKHQRNKKWYIIASIVALLLIVWAIIDKNYFFALIIILSSALIVFYDGENPKKIMVEIQHDGLFVGEPFYEFQSISNFYIIYKPQEKIKKLFLEFKNPLKHRLSIPLEDQDPVEIRKFLLKYLKEDLEKENEPLSEGLSKLFKI